ncbi:MAG: hypothetical protein JWN63_522 [Candidatus Acidoferrum typicum]|nr:hypothetical protein [Candidatus Acidoferrum typicum]
MGKELQYEVTQDSGATISSVRKLAREVWHELQTEGSEAREDAKRAGIDLETIPSTLEKGLELRPSGAAFEPGSMALVVSGMLLHVAGQASLDLWKYVLLPRIRERWGDHALRERKQPAKKSAEKVNAKKSSSKSKQKLPKRLGKTSAKKTRQRAQSG